ncbi:MAG TPA: hypothetical protein H9903_12720 [Candidatus Aquabacterium excrementipullorum]|nr:hypothetical protein [Candidatus Aquabacterium excrementipullorum]
MTSIDADAVVEFLHRFEALAEQEDFALIEPMIAPLACRPALTEEAPSA